MISHRKGKSFEEQYGKERAKEIKEKKRISNIGKHSNPRKINPITEINRVRKIKENAKLNPNFGMKGKKQSAYANELTKLRRKNLILPKKDTSIEVKIQNFLKQLGIDFFTHQYMHIEHGYQCDILIPSKNLVIECDGNYWHSYPTGNEIDHIRTSELISKGFKVLRLWECEIKEMDLNKFKERLNV